MSTVLDIPAHEAHVVRVFAVIDGAAPLSDAEVIAALGAGGDLCEDEIELFDLGDLGTMPLSDYLAEGHGIARADLDPMRGQIDGLAGRVLILPSRAFGGAAMALRVGRGLRLVARFEEDVVPVRFDPLPAGGAAGSVSPPAKARDGKGPARLAVIGFFAGLAVLAGIVAWLAGAR
ncbi:hypothetical protein ABIE58_003144 [Roseovarius sp. MBR-78]|uniref:hypothetical protein n=1 Tax=Roseovarius sp. MBR-78 TaxID=3156460 RepID=UPI0033964855